MVARLVLKLFIICMSVVAANKPAPFGTLLGVTDGHTDVYACNLPPEVDPTAMDPNYVNGVYTGIRWQCVELARRYLYLNFGVVFDSVDYAYQIYDFDSFIDVAKNASVAITKHPNGYHKPPQHGSLLIWSPYGEMGEYGHVAVAVKVTDTYIDIVEQNLEDTIWPKGQHYSRRLHVQKNATSYLIKKWFDKEHIIGWITIDTCGRKLQEQTRLAPANFDVVILASFVIVLGAVGLIVYRQQTRRSSDYSHHIPLLN